MLLYIALKMFKVYMHNDKTLKEKVIEKKNKSEKSQAEEESENQAQISPEAFEFSRFIEEIFNTNSWEDSSDNNSSFYSTHEITLNHYDGTKHKVYITCRKPFKQDILYLDHTIEYKKDGKYSTYIRKYLLKIIRYEVYEQEPLKNNQSSHIQIYTKPDGINEIYKQAKENGIQNGYYYAPFTNYFNETSAQKLIECHLLNDNRAITLRSAHTPTIKDSRIYGDSYYDDKGVYLATFTESDYYKSTHILIQDTYKHDDSEVKFKNTEFWLPKHCFTDMPGYKRMLWNIYVPNINERAEQEIDCLVISEYGFFCVEVKNWCPPIHFHKVDDEEWLNGNNERHQSPLRQNSGHILGIRDLLEQYGAAYTKKIPIYNVIGLHKRIKTPRNVTILHYECEDMIRQYEIKHNKVLIGDEDTLTYKLQNNDNIYNKKYLSKENVNSLYELLLTFTLKSDVEKDSNIRQKMDEHA